MSKPKYDENFPLLAQDYARQGLIDTEIAAKLGIGTTVYYEYQNIHPEFADAIKAGKRPVDVEVENALLKRALGFEYEEVSVEYKPKGKDLEEEGKPKRPTLVRKIKKFVVPDTTACIFWSKNRRPGLWRDKHDLELSGGVSIRVVSAVPRSKEKGNNGKIKKK